MAESLGTAVLHLAVESTGLVGGMKKAQGKVATSMAAMAATGKKMTTHLTLPLVAVGAASIHLAREFDGSMRKVQTLVGVSQKQVEAWKEDILDMSHEVGKSPKELADGLFFVTSAGFRGAAALDVLRVSAKASRVGLGETKVVADLLTSAINSYGKENLTASQAADTLTGMVRAGKAEATDFAPVLGAILPLASELGVGFNEVGGSLAQMTRLGVPASRAATQLQAIMSGLLKPTAEAERTLKSVGLSAGGLRAELKDKGVISVLDTLKTAFHGNVEQMAAVFPNIRALRGVLALVGKAGADTATVFDQVKDSAGAMDAGFKTVSETSGFKMDQALDSLQVAAIRVGRVLLPIAASVASFLGGIASGFSQLPGPAQRFIVIFGLIAAAAGPALIVLTKLIGILLALRTAFIAMSVAAGLSAGPFGLFLGAAFAVGAAIGIVTGAMSGGASAASRYAQATRDAKAALDSLRQSTLDEAQASINLQSAHLEVKAAAQGLKDVQAQVNSGQIKGKAASLALSQAELRVQQSHLGVKQAAKSMGDATKKAADDRGKLSQSSRTAITAAREELQQARLGVTLFGANSQATARLSAAKRALATALRNAGISSKAMGASVKTTESIQKRAGDAAKGAGGNFQQAGGKARAAGAGFQAAGGQAQNSAGKVRDLGSALGNLPRHVPINIEVKINKTTFKKEVDQTIDGAKRSSEKSSNELGDGSMKSMARGAKRGAPKVKQVITETVKNAINEAKRALTQMGQNIASTLSEAIDESTRRKVVALGNTPAAQELRALQQAMDADAAAHERASLQARINAAETAEERAEAVRDLNRFDTEARMDALQLQLQQAEDAYNQDADNRKQALQRGLDDLTDMLNRGAITQAEFATRAQELIAAQAPEYERVGALLGDATGRGYVDAWRAMLTQAGLVNAFGAGVIPGSGADLGFLDPRRAAKQEMLELINTLSGRATSESSPGGKKITSAEQQAINAVRARIKALGIAKGGIVGGPGSTKSDRAGLFRLSRGEGVFRSSAMEGMQRFFEGGGGGTPVAVHFHGPVIGGGNSRALGRELARIIEPELNRRVSLGAA